MNPPDNDVITFIKDFLWAPLLGLIAWAWKWNSDEHARLWKATEKLKENTTMSYSSLNDRIMDHVDNRVNETLRVMREEDSKLMAELSMQRGHIGKLFDKLEEHGQHSQTRHNEVLNTLREMTNTFHQALSQKADK